MLHHRLAPLRALACVSTVLIPFALAALASSASAQNLNWQRVYEPGVGGAVVGLSISPHDRDTVVAGGDILGLARTTDFGVTWNQALAGLQSYDYGEITWHPNPSTATRNRVWAASSNGPHLSTDGGLTWTLKRSGMPNNGSNVFTAPTQVVLHDPANHDRLLAFFGNRRDEDGGFYSGKLRNTGHVYVSTNYGDTWTKLAEIVPGVTNDSANVLAATYLAGSSSQTLLAAVRGRGIYRSTTNGASWTLSNTGLPSTNVRYVVAHPTNANIAWVAMGGGSAIFKTTDGGLNWFASRAGLNLADNYRHIAVSKSNPDILYTINKGPKQLYRSTDGGANWTSLSAPSAKAINIGFEAGQIDIDPVDPNRVFVSTWNSIFRSYDGGATWADLSSYRPNPSAQPNHWRGRGYSGYVSLNFYWNPALPDRSYTLAMDDGLWISTDNLKSWRSGDASGLPAFGGYSDMSFTADGLTIYATRGQPGWSLGHDIVKSTDGGLNWTQTTYPRSDRTNQWAFPRGVYVHPTDANRVWVTIGGRLYYSSTGGSSWIENPLDDTQPTGSGISNAGGRRLEYIAARGTSNPTEFFVGGRRGVYHTTNGTDFTLIPGSPKNWEFGATRIRPDPTNPNRIYVVNWGYFEGSEGVWRGTFNTSTGNWSWSRLIGWGFITPNVKYLTDIAINPANPDQAVIATRKDGFEAVLEGQGIYVTSNLTAATPSWTVQNTGLSMRRVNSVRFKPGSEGIVVAGTGGGGYYIAKWDGSAVNTGVGVAGPDDPGAPTELELYAQASDAEARRVGIGDGGGTVGNATATELHVGNANNGGSAYSPVYVFQLPNLGAVSNPFTTATFTVGLSTSTSTFAGHNVDVYGLTARTAPDVLAADAFAGALDATGATRLADNWINLNVSPAVPTGLRTLSNVALVSYLNAQYASGAGAGKYVFLRLSPDAAGNTWKNVKFAASEYTANPAWRPRLVVE